MILNRSGAIAPGLYVAGPAEVPVFLLDGDRPALVDAGFACLADIYVDHIRGILNGRSPAYALVTHSHFDHLGAVYWLKKAFPEMAVCGSPRIDRIMERSGAVEVMRMLSRAARETIAAEGVDMTRAPGFEPFALDQSLGDGDTLSLSQGVDVVVYETPGHTRDCLSYYVPATRTLIASEAMGIPDATGYVFADFLVDYDIYMDSMKKLSRLDVDVLCFGHSYVYTGDDAVNYMPRAMACAEEFYRRTKQCLEEEGGGIERVKQRLKAFEYDGKPGPKQPEPAYLLNLGARILTVQRREAALREGKNP
ncbi:MAG: MBL fold metallo-hydrolase [Thermodesulfobacteriota bacterium]